MSRRILVVDDEESILRSLEGVLHDEGYEVVTASSGEEALEKVEAEDPDLVLLDVWLPGKDGIETLEALRGRLHGLPVLMMSGHGSIETAVKATRLGAHDFIEKPLNLDKVLLAIGHAFRASRLAEENRFWRDKAERECSLLGESPAMEALREQIRVVAPTKASVLITGENGTGKELVARAVHNHSKRRDGPFVEVNCAAIPEDLIESELFGHEKGAFTGAAARRRGKFDLADGGTLFLDEIGDMSLKTQAKILRVLQEMRFERVGGSRTHQVDVRIIAATNKDLDAEIRQGTFREDLYFRLNVIPFHVPPLRERTEDIALFTEHFLRQHGAEEGREPVSLHPEVLELLKAHDWPGNVRELKNVTQRMLILSRGAELRARDLPPGLRVLPADADDDAPAAGGLGLRQARRAFERRYILRCLEAVGWNVPQAADRLELDKSSLYKKMKELGIEIPPDG
ncbi:MAG: sigma-54-dependent Fis family transcriptional regulator [Deltaproteobacteria bacterium]|nr:sigma-54-dependent Fis family transcriptional regulator [Deltaproteobacteria bacterium]